MPLEGKGRFYKRKSDGAIFISGSLIKDSQFPFSDRDKLKIKNDTENKSLIITHAEEEED